MSDPDPFAELRAPLATWLAGQLSAAVEISDLERPAVGQSNDTTLFTATWTQASQPHRARLVLRRQAGANPIFREPDVIREARVLQGLAGGSRVPVPDVRWCETDPAVLGAPFFVMTAVPGRVPAGRPSIHTVGWLPTLTTRERERLWASAMETLVAVHDVDWQRSHAFLLGDDAHGATLDAHVDRLADWYAWSAAGREFPLTDAALDVLDRAPI